MLEVNGIKVFYVCWIVGCVVFIVLILFKVFRLFKVIVGLVVYWFSRGIGICCEGLVVWLMEVFVSLWCSCKFMS